MFRNPDEWRRAREAAVALLDERLTLPRGESPGQTFDRLYPCPSEPDRAEDPPFLAERYWCGCVRESRWVPRCERHTELEHDEEPMTRAQEERRANPPPPDAESERVLAAFEHAIEAINGGETLSDLSPKIVAVKAARAAVLARMQPSGEEMTVQRYVSEDGFSHAIIDCAGKFIEGQRVRVVKVEEGA